MPKIADQQITLRTLSVASFSRSIRWHGGKIQWSLLEWAGAMCGEAGEAANVAKKIKRIDSDMTNIDLKAMPDETRKDLCNKLAKEAADTILYAVLVIEESGHDLEETIREVFNQKSEEYGFPERL